mmetsp:Transcript_12402/g.31299  ORF Transcript_12402/g.31299 Transcript_12402/m.31299 type:complete len:209 (+) Transcript_12402:544-1170(+)
MALCLFALSAFAGVTLLQRLSISKAVNLLRMSSCNVVLHFRSWSKHATSACNFSAFLVSFGSSLFCNRSSERSATAMAASTSSACVSKFFFFVERSAVRRAIASSVLPKAFRDSALTREIKSNDRALKFRLRPNNLCVSSRSFFESNLSPAGAAPSVGAASAAGAGAGAAASLAPSAGAPPSPVSPSAGAPLSAAAPPPLDFGGGGAT